MTEGVVQLLSQGSSTGTHFLNDIDGQTVREVLISKHPPGEPLHEAVLKPRIPPEQAHAIMVSATTREVIMKSVLNTNGAAGPSGMDANGWRRICSSFHSASDAFCDALALCARRIATTAIYPSSLEAYTAFRLIHFRQATRSSAHRNW